MSSRTAFEGLIKKEFLPKGTLLRSRWECKLVQPLWRTLREILKTRKIELPYDPAIPLLGVHPDKVKIQKDTCILKFTASLLTTARHGNKLNTHSQMNG